MKYLYTQTNMYGRTGFGITGDLEERRCDYEGHNGFQIEFDQVYYGPDNHIEDLEHNIKKEFHEHLFRTGNKKATDGYEWVNETVDTDQVKSWIRWEVENTYEGIINET